MAQQQAGKTFGPISGQCSTARQEPEVQLAAAAVKLQEVGQTVLHHLQAQREVQAGRRPVKDLVSLPLVLLMAVSPLEQPLKVLI